MSKNELKKFLLTSIIIVMSSLFFFACGEVSGFGSGGSVLTGFVRINGTARVDETLTANTDNLILYGSSGSFSYQWKRGATEENVDTDIDGATNRDYVLTDTDLNKYITVTVSHSNYEGSKTSATNIISKRTGQGNGSAGDPFLVENVANLQQVGIGTGGWTLSAHYRQTADIDIGSITNWTPIGINRTNAFIGTYHGNNKNISNLKINTASDFQGLFGCLESGGVIKNIELENVDITGGNSVGGLVGENRGTVLNCYSTGDISGTGEGVGGVMGFAVNGTVKNCFATGNVKGTRYVGGVAGRHYMGVIKNCYSTGNISGTGDRVGGVVGYFRGIAENCYATGSVEGHNYVGGVVGTNEIEGIIANCYATGNVKGNGDNVGGIVGHNGQGELGNCFSTGVVIGTGDYVAGVVGSNGPLGIISNCVTLSPTITGSSNIGRVKADSVGTLINSYARQNMLANGTPSTSTDANSINGAYITASQYHDANWWIGTALWDGDIWDISNGSLPILKNMPGYRIQNPTVK